MSSNRAQRLLDLAQESYRKRKAASSLNEVPAWFNEVIETRNIAAVPIKQASFKRALFLETQHDPEQGIAGQAGEILEPSLPSSSLPILIPSDIESLEVSGGDTFVIPLRQMHVDNYQSDTDIIHFQSITAEVSDLAGTSELHQASEYSDGTIGSLGTESPGGEKSQVNESSVSDLVVTPELHQDPRNKDGTASPCRNNPVGENSQAKEISGGVSLDVPESSSKSHAHETTVTLTRVAIDESRDVTLEIYDDDRQPDFFMEAHSDSEEVPMTTEAHLTTPSIVKKRTRVDAPRKNVRARIADHTKWKVNVSKTALNTGKAHTSLKTGKQRRARELKPACSTKCNRCSHDRRLTEEERQLIHEKFWELNDHNKQLNFVFSCITSKTPEKKFADPGKAGVSLIRNYCFKVNGKDLRVCKFTFLNTLDISDSWIKTATNHSRGETGFTPSDKRGKHSNRPNRTQEETKTSVRLHINLIPRTESHYTRERTKREYVDSDLTVEELYRRYQKWMEAQNEGKEEKDMVKVASLSAYRTIFNEEFNIGLFQPKSNQCLECVKYKRATTAEKEKLQDAYSIHRANRDFGNRLKENCKLEAERHPDKKCVATFDLQKILSMPKSEVSEFFYESKVNLHNLCVFNMGPKHGYCYMWNETVAKKGSTEVCSGLYHFIGKISLEGIEEFEILSDNPTSQNKNRFVFAMLLFACVKFKVKIRHTFLEVGHTHMEVDSMHAAIERFTKKKEIFDQEEWYSHIKGAKKTALDPCDRYEIIELGKTCPILDFKALVGAQNWQKFTNKDNVMWSKVRQVAVDPATPNLVYVKYDFNEPAMTLDVTQKKGRPVNLATYQPASAYLYRFPLSEQKVKSLQKLMQSEAIPSKYHAFYEELISVRDEDAQDCHDDCLCCEREDDNLVEENGLNE